MRKTQIQSPARGLEKQPNANWISSCLNTTKTEKFKAESSKHKG